MKRFILAVAFGLMAIAAQAEATFDQIEGLIQQRQYAAAEQGLEVIIKNHPQSAKAFYAMAQAQAGLGNLEKAQKALNIATGLNPTLDFAPASSVASLRQAITPQTAKIEAVEESHFWRNFAYVVMFALFGWACYFLWCVYNRKKDEDEGTGPFKSSGSPDPKPTPPTSPTTHVDRVNSMPLRPATPAPAYAAPAPAPAPTYSAPAPTHTTVVNNSSNDMLTGVLIGNMLSSHHHDTERTVVRETVREVPAPSRDSSWDDAPAKAAKSSWDDTPSTSSRSSSWDSDSSSSSSSSWSSSSSSDSGSSWSSSDSSSSSSWD